MAYGESGEGSLQCPISRDGFDRDLPYSLCDVEISVSQHILYRIYYQKLSLIVHLVTPGRKNCVPVQTRKNESDTITPHNGFVDPDRRRDTRPCNKIRDSQTSHPEAASPNKQGFNSSHGPTRDACFRRPWASLVTLLYLLATASSLGDGQGLHH